MSPGRADFPSMPTKTFKRLLIRELGYEVSADSGPGSHEWLVHPERQRLRWAFHRREIGSLEVRNVLIRQVGLTLDEAKEVLRRA